MRMTQVSSKPAITKTKSLVNVNDIINLKEMDIDYSLTNEQGSFGGSLVLIA